MSGISKKKDNAPVINTSENDQLIRQAVAVFQSGFSLKELPPLEITVTSGLPAGSGLGSSAAVAAATIGALMKAVKGLWNPVRIHELAHEVEKIAHGNPSGADVTAVVYGGLVWFRKEFEFLRSIWSLPLGQYTIPRFFAIDTGKPQESTKEMVKVVASKMLSPSTSLRVNNRTKIEQIFSDQERQTKRLILALRSADTKELVATIMQGEHNLEQLGVVGQKAQRVIRDIESSGGAAKISGAGGVRGGSGILLCYHADAKKIAATAKKYQLHFFDVTVAEEGVRIEK